jgi:hypothetical protein
MQSSTGRQITVSVDGRVGASGRLSPLINLFLKIETEDHQMRIPSLFVELWSGGELIGDGYVSGATLRKYARQAQVSVRTSHRAIEWVTHRLGRESSVSLELRLSGAIQFRPDANTGGVTESWVDDELARTGVGHQITISRSDWFEHVLKPVRHTDFIYLEVATPHGPAKEQWNEAIQLLNDAERAYALGDDVSVFANLRGCLESLPGAKTAIFDSVADPGKRKAIDSLTKELVNYLHTGRHVASSDSPEAGTFPVNHIDAAFALSAVKVLLAYASLILAAEPGP